MQLLTAPQTQSIQIGSPVLFERLCLMGRLCDGTGRRTGLKILGPQGRAGSIPARGTNTPSILKTGKLVDSLDKRLALSPQAFQIS